MTEREGRFNPEEDKEGEDITNAYQNMEPNDFWEYLGNMPRETKVVLTLDIKDADPKSIHKIASNYSTAEITISSDSEITQLERKMFPVNVKWVEKS